MVTLSELRVEPPDLSSSPAAVVFTTVAVPVVLTVKSGVVVFKLPILPEPANRSIDVEPVSVFPAVCVMLPELVRFTTVPDTLCAILSGPLVSRVIEPVTVTFPEGARFKVVPVVLLMKTFPLVVLSCRLLTAVCNLDAALVPMLLVVPLVVRKALFAVSVAPAAVEMRPLRAFVVRLADPTFTFFCKVMVSPVTVKVLSEVIVPRLTAPRLSI